MHTQAWNCDAVCIYKCDYGDSMCLISIHTIQKYTHKDLLTLHCLYIHSMYYILYICTHTHIGTSMYIAHISSGNGSHRLSSTNCCRPFHRLHTQRERERERERERTQPHHTVIYTTSYTYSGAKHSSYRRCNVHTCVCICATYVFAYANFVSQCMYIYVSTVCTSNVSS